MKPVLAVALASLSLVGGIVGPAGAAPTRSGCHRGAPPIIRDGFPTPQLRYSSGGRLETSLTARQGPVTIDGERVRGAKTYDGLYPGPLLMLCAGDRMEVDFRNRLSQVTNLHMHGFHVNPNRNHDNVYLNLKPGRRFHYEYSIPRDMPPGTYWYHPHRHHYVSNQIFVGMAGAVVLEGGLDRVPALRDVPQRLMVLQNAQVKGRKLLPEADSPGPGQLVYVNGELNPTARIRPGELQRWRIFNASANRMVVLMLQGQSFEVLAQDGNTLRRPRTVEKLKLAPGSRREVLVRGKAGSRQLVAVPFAQFPGGGKFPPQPVATVEAEGGPVPKRRRAAVPRTLDVSPQADLRKTRVDRKRTIVYSERQLTKTKEQFLLNGLVFDPQRVITMKLDTVEQWKLVNDTDQWHTFHIHINPFQVIRVGDRRMPFVDYQDNVMIPPKSFVVMRTRPKDFTGKFVFHCHVTFHEDHGMMAAVQVKRNPTPDELAAGVSVDGQMTVASGALGSRREPELVPSRLALAPAVPLGSAFHPGGGFLYCRLGREA